MSRVELFEFEDQPWFPHRLRTAMTAYLAVTYRLAPVPKVWAGQLTELLKKDQVNEIVDLGSGGGGPIPLVADELRRMGFEVRVTLTDLYPHPDLAGYWPDPVDAEHVPSALSGTRTMFAAFHHHSPDKAKRILTDAFEHRVPICIFEGTSRTPAAIAIAFLISLMVLLLTPLVRPVSWFQLLFTYLVPILPLLIFWDGFVSQLRTYSAEELTAMTASMRSPQYVWDVGTIRPPGSPYAVPYLIGRPVD